MKGIKFKKVERFCPYNTGIREGKETGRIIYDYEVWDNGVKTGVFSKVSFAFREYRLIDTAGYNVRDIKEKPTIARSKAQFEAVYTNTKHLIPTPEQIAEREAKKQKEKEEREKIEKQEHARWMIEQAAEDMYEALKHIVDTIGMTPETENAEMKIIARQAIAKVEGGK